jgi:hypothetical protein
MVIMHQEFLHLSKQLFLRKLCWGSAILGMTLALVQLPAVSGQLSKSDNIYREKDNLPDNADVFPRMGKIGGYKQEQTNCRVVPWGRVASRFSGNSFVEIDRRQVDSNGESWFRNPDRGCWIHDSRIDLL